MACFTRNGDDESFGRGSGRVSSLDISTQSGERFPRRIPRANLSETGPKKRDIYREDLKYKVARGDKEREALFLFSARFRIPIVRYLPRGSCPEIQRPRSKGNVDFLDSFAKLTKKRNSSSSSSRVSCSLSPNGIRYNVGFVRLRERKREIRLLLIAAAPSRKIFVNNESRRLRIYFRHRPLSAAKQM